MFSSKWSTYTWHWMQDRPELEWMKTLESHSTKKIGFVEQRGSYTRHWCKQWSHTVQSTTRRCSTAEYIYLTLNAGQAWVGVDANTGVPHLNKELGGVQQWSTYTWHWMQDRPELEWMHTLESHGSTYSGEWFIMLKKEKIKGEI